MIGIGVIGCGYWGPNLVRNFSEVREATVIACCDLRQERLDYVQQRFPHVETATDYHDLLKNPTIDAICVATPVSTHYRIAKDALLCDKHVLVEKPMASTSQEAIELINLARERGKTLMVGHTFEYTGAVNKIKEIVASGELGNIYYFDSVRVNLGLFQNDINVIWDLAPHDISILLYVLNARPVSLSARGESHIAPGIEDVAYITLHFPDKTMANIHVSWLAPVKFRRMTISGSKKMIVYDDIENIEKVKVYDRGVVVNRDPKGILERQLFYRTGDVWSPKLDTTEPLKVECSHFVDCIINSKEPRSNGEAGLWVVKILEAADRSMKKGGALEELR
jgi:predicted dehydrogenase